MSKTGKDWDIKLCHAEFAYYITPTYATKHSPFEIVYGVNPYVHIYLIELPKNEYIQSEAKKYADNMVKFHKLVCERIEKVNEKYK